MRLSKLVAETFLNLHDFAHRVQQVVELVVEVALCIQVLDLVALLLELLLQLVDGLGQLLIFYLGEVVSTTL